MIQWEYKAALGGHVSSGKERETFLNEFGEQGWELVCTREVDDIPWFYFKRPKEGSYR